MMLQEKKFDQNFQQGFDKEIVFAADNFGMKV